MSSVDVTVAWAAAVGGAVALGAAAMALRTQRAAKKRRVGIASRLTQLADELTEAGRRIAADGPVARTAIEALAPLMPGRTGQKLREEQKMIDELLTRARVLESAVQAVASPSEARESDSLEALEKKLQFLLEARTRMQGIRDTLDARMAVLRTSAQAMRRARGTNA